MAEYGFGSVLFCCCCYISLPLPPPSSGLPSSSSRGLRHFQWASASSAAQSLPWEEQGCSLRHGQSTCCRTWRWELFKVVIKSDCEGEIVWFRGLWQSPSGLWDEREKSDLGAEQRVRERSNLASPSQRWVTLNQRQTHDPEKPNITALVIFHRQTIVAT